MDRYKYATVFETLAIKIVDAAFGFDVDLEKSHITSKSHDQGIDAVIFLQSDKLQLNRTIEAKLRNPKYTLGLKDIASSLIFFLIRKGDEHYIVSNVYLTEGTIQVLNDLNLSQGTSLFYVDGEITRNALFKIKDKLSGDERILAEELIKEFSQLKKRGKNKPKSTIKHEDNKEILFASRQKSLDVVESLILNKVKLINISGKQGIGKSIFLDTLNQRVLKSGMKVIKIDTEAYNTIPMVCYEIASAVLGLQVNELFKQISLEEDLSLDSFNPEELKQVSFLFQFFNTRSNFPETTTYVALKGLNAILKMNENKRILIELENFSLTSREVFDFFKKKTFSFPDNVQVVAVNRTGMVNGLILSDQGYTCIHQNEYAEYEIEATAERESVQFLLSKNVDLDEECAIAIHHFATGIPGKLDYISKVIKAEKPVLLTSAHIEHFLLRQDIIQHEIKMWSEETAFLKLFLLLVIFENRLRQVDVEQFVNIGFFSCKEIEMISPYIENSKWLCKRNGFISFEKKLDIKLAKDVLEQKYDILYRFLMNLLVPESITLPPLGQIIWSYFKNDPQIFLIYDQFKSFWEYKYNMDWKMNSLEYIVHYIIRNQFFQVDDVLNSISYVIEHLELCVYEEPDEICFLSEEVQRLERNFDGIDIETKARVADTLARYAILQYNQFRKKSHIEMQKKAIIHAINAKWYPFASLKNRIILHRYQLLQLKSVENKQMFYDALEVFYKKFQGDAYAETVYYGNKAARYYGVDTEKSLQYLFSCPLVELEKQYPEEKRLMLWIQNDIALCHVIARNMELAKTQLTTYIEENRRLAYDENLSRSNNLLGLLAAMQGNQKTAEEYLHKAVCYSYHTNLDAFFHFTINYLTYYSLNKEKFINLIMEYLKQKHHEISEHLKKNKQQNNRWYISLTAFQEILKQNDEPSLEIFRHLFNDVKLDTNCIDSSFFIDGRLFVVF